MPHEKIIKVKEVVGFIPGKDPEEPLGTKVLDTSGVIWGFPHGSVKTAVGVGEG